MSAHTPWNGTLALCEITDSGEQHVRDAADISVCICENPDFAARIVACINACEGIPREQLEREGVRRTKLTAITAARDSARRSDAAQLSRAVAMQAERDALRTQIQTLRAALESVRAALTGGGALDCDDCDDCDTLYRAVHAALEETR